MGPVISTYRSIMADAAPADRGGFRGGFGGRGRGRGRGGRGGRGRGRGRGKEEKEWVPITKLGRLVKDGKIKSLQEIYLFSLPIKEFEIILFHRACIERRSFENYACSETDQSWSKNSLQGFCSYWRLQWTRRIGSEML